MGRHIFGKCQRSRDNVLVQKINVITIRVGGVIVKGEVSRKHRVLIPHVSKSIQTMKWHSMDTYQNNTATPDVNLAPSIQRVAHDQLRGCIARTSAARLHQITAPHTLSVRFV